MGEYRELEMALIRDQGLMLAGGERVAVWSAAEREDELDWRAEELKDWRQRRERRRFILRLLTL